MIKRCKKKQYFKNEKRNIFGEYVPGTDGDDFGLFIKAGRILREELDAENASSQEEESKEYIQDDCSEDEVIEDQENFDHG